MAACGLLFGASRYALALDPKKDLTQYTRTVWTQEQGLPQDTIRAIVQSSDGYLWLGTDEGLARFDGYEFVVFNKDRGDLPDNSVTALAAADDGALWIGTADGLVCYRNKSFRTYTARDGLPDDGVSYLLAAQDGSLWVVAGVYVSRFQAGRFTTYAPGKNLPMASARTVYEDRSHAIWVAGFGGVARLAGNSFVAAPWAARLGNDVFICLLKDRQENLWVAGTLGLWMVSAHGNVRQYGVRNGLPDAFVRSLWEDRDGNIWAGTNGGLARFQQGRFATPNTGESSDRDWVRCIYEDREGNLWVGMNHGLNRLRDDIFTIYSKSEGLPSDQPTTVYEDSRGRVWVGFHDSGLVQFGASSRRHFTTRNGLLSNEVFSIREDRHGDLLVSTREGFSRMRGDRFESYVPPDPLSRRIVFDALEDRKGRLWLATPGGLAELRGTVLRNVIPGGPLLNNAVVVLAEGRDGSIWAGTYGKGLWRIQDGRSRLFSEADGLASDQIRSLMQDPDGTLWIGTFGAGLVRLRDGRFVRYSSRDGLLSDNISHVADDGQGSLWLSTPRGICRVNRKELEDFAAGTIKVLTPVNYGVEDGLRSAQCAPGYPTGGGAYRSAGGRLWFPTGRGLAVLDPNAPKPKVRAPQVLFEIIAEGTTVDLSRPARLPGGTGRIQVRYTGIHLGAPERVRYAYRLEGVDNDWVQAGSRRVISYNSLKHGSYRFTVRADVAGGPAGELSYAFELLPRFYETWWFRMLAVAMVIVAGLAAYSLRLRTIRGRFSLVLEERTRLAREIHDTLAQGFVGISSQLDAVAMCIEDRQGPAWRYLDMARKMARHSLTEARRSVMDLRASVLEGQDLAAALQSGARMWTAGANVDVEVEVSGPRKALPHEMEQHLLRIAQEAVANTLKHGEADKISVRLQMEPRKVNLRIADNGRGFDRRDAFSTTDGHFGLLGMRERAERLGGQLRLESQPGQGTQVEVVVPLA